MTKTLDELRADLRAGEVCGGKLKKDMIGWIESAHLAVIAAAERFSGRPRLPRFDARKNFGLDPKVWLRKDWSNLPCEGYGSSKHCKCKNTPTSLFPTMQFKRPDHRYCRDCAKRWADYFTLFVNGANARNAKNEAKGAATIRAATDKKRR